MNFSLNWYSRLLNSFLTVLNGCHSSSPVTPPHTSCSGPDSSATASAFAVEAETATASALAVDAESATSSALAVEDDSADKSETYLAVESWGPHKLQKPKWDGVGARRHSHFQQVLFVRIMRLEQPAVAAARKRRIDGSEQSLGSKL